jgi:uncharacterized protein RhaS with RHS repeats
MYALRVPGQTYPINLTLYRAYSPGLGRWLSRDPIGENGGLNLYGFVGNDPVNFWDPLGLIRYGFYSTGSDKNAFQARAEKGAGVTNSKGFGSGYDLLGGFKSSPEITRADIHSHGFSEGVIGDSWDNGFYRDSYAGATDSARIQDFIDAVRRGEIDLAKNAEVNFYGCNSDSLAQDLSKALSNIGRGDVLVTGASSKVSSNATETSARVDSPGNFNTYQDGKLIEAVRTRPYR